MGHPDTAMEEAVRSPKSLVDGLQTRFFVVDAFTSTRFPELKGNPAGVLIKSAPLKDDLAVQIAKQMSSCSYPSNQTLDKLILWSYG